MYFWFSLVSNDQQITENSIKKKKSKALPKDFLPAKKLGTQVNTILWLASPSSNSTMDGYHKLAPHNLEAGLQFRTQIVNNIMWSPMLDIHTRTELPSH